MHRGSAWHAVVRGQVRTFSVLYVKRYVEPDPGDPYRVRGRTGRWARRPIRHVAPVIWAVEVHSIPAVRELDVRLYRLATACAIRWLCEERPGILTAPRQRLGVLDRLRRIQRVATSDHFEVRGNLVDPGRSAIVKETMKDRYPRAVLLVERRYPVATSIALGVAPDGSFSSRHAKERRVGVGGGVADELVQVRCPR